MAEATPECQPAAKDFVRRSEVLIQFVLAAVLWLVLLGWAIHLWSIIDAAMFKPKP